MKSLIQVVFLSAIVMVLAMCSNPSEPEENTPLSERETEELLMAMMVVVSDTMPQITAIDEVTEELTIACPEGGEARVSVNATDEMPNDSTARLTVGIDFTPNECGIQGNEGTEFTLNAERSINFLTILTIQGFFENVEVGGGLVGQLDWMVESRSGTCPIDMDLELEEGTDLLDSRSRLFGSACDHELNLDVSSLVQSGPGSEQIRRKPVRPRL